MDPISPAPRFRIRLEDTVDSLRGIMARLDPATRLRVGAYCGLAGPCLFAGETREQLAAEDHLDEATQIRLTEERVAIVAGKVRAKILAEFDLEKGIDQLDREEAAVVFLLLGTALIARGINATMTIRVGAETPTPEAATTEPAAAPGT